MNSTNLNADSAIYFFATIFILNWVFEKRQPNISQMPNRS